MPNLSTCGRCGGTLTPGPDGYVHTADTTRTRGHRPDPDDSAVATD